MWFGGWGAWGDQVVGRDGWVLGKNCKDCLNTFCLRPFVYPTTTNHHKPPQTTTTTTTTTLPPTPRQPQHPTTEPPSDHSDHHNHSNHANRPNVQTPRCPNTYIEVNNNTLNFILQKQVSKFRFFHEKTKINSQILIQLNSILIGKFSNNTNREE